MSYKSLLFKKHSIFASWLFSYMSILLIPIIISNIVYFVSGKVIENEVNSANSAMLKQVQQVVDSQMDSVETLSTNVALNPRINAFMYTSPPLSNFTNYTITEIIRDFAVYNVTHGFIDDFYVYFKNTDLILRASGMYNTHLLYDDVYKGSNVEYDQWYDLIREKHVKEYIPLGRKTVNGEELRSVTYFQSLPIMDPGQGIATIAITLNEARLLEIIKNISIVNKGTVLVLDKNDNIIASTQPVKLPETISYSGIKDSSGLFYNYINGEKVVLSYATSEVCDWKYISIIPTRIFMKKVEDIQKLIILSVFLCLSLGVVVAYVFSKRNYNPVNELIQSISKRTRKVPDGTYSEYNFIREAFSNTFDEKERINEKLIQQNRALKSNYLMKLMKGKLKNVDIIQDILKSFDISFVSDYFAVIVFFVEDYSELFKSSKNENYEENVKLVQFIICNVVEELAGQNNNGYMVETDDMLACLINFSSINAEENNKELMRIASEAQSFIKEKFSIYLTIAISEIHKDFIGISEAYNEASEAMEYKMIIGENKIIKYEDIKIPTQSYEYSLESEYQLINYIKIGDYENAKGILDRVFENNFASGSMPIQMARCLLFDLISTMIKALDSVNFAYEGSFLEQFNPVEKLIGSKTIKEMKNHMDKILYRICDYVNNSKKSHNKALCNDIVKFIESNYTDMNLSISLIAEKFGVNPVYLSRLFKEQSGEGVLDYINKSRLNEAKRLLRKSSLNIADTANKVGYFNSNALIRAFKKYEGITPGQYKEMKV